MKKRVLGIAVIVIAAFMAGYLTKAFTAAAYNPGEKAVSDKAAEEQSADAGAYDRAAYPDPAAASDDTNENKEKDAEVKFGAWFDKNPPPQSRDNSNIAEIDDGLDLEMPDDMLAALPASFKDELKVFLKENMLMTLGTCATSDGRLTVSYNDKTYEFYLMINNYANTCVTVKVDLEGNIEFAYR